MTHPNPDPYQRDSITSDTSPCPTCQTGRTRRTTGMVCQTCGRDYRDFGAPDARVPMIFDGPALVMPDSVKPALGLKPEDHATRLDMSGVLLLVVVTDDEQAHVGGPATTAEKLDLLRQVLDGLEQLQ